MAIIQDILGALIEVVAQRMMYFYSNAFESI